MLVVLLFSLRSAIVLLGSTIAVFVYMPSTIGAFALMAMWAVPPFWSVPPEHVTTPLACEQLKPLSPLAETNWDPVGSVSLTTTP